MWGSARPLRAVVRPQPVPVERGRPYREFNGIYYGDLPGRCFGPFLLAWLCALPAAAPVPTWPLFGFAGLVVLNNYEFGIGALLGLDRRRSPLGCDRAVPLRPRASGSRSQGVAGLLAAVAFVSADHPGEDRRAARSGAADLLQQAVPARLLRARADVIARAALALYATYAAALLMAAVRYVRRDPDRVADRDARLLIDLRPGHRHVLRRTLVPVPANALLPGLGLFAGAGGLDGGPRAAIGPQGSRRLRRPRDSGVRRADRVRRLWSQPVRSSASALVPGRTPRERRHGGLRHAWRPALRRVPNRTGRAHTAGRSAAGPPAGGSRRRGQCFAPERGLLADLPQSRPTAPWISLRDEGGTRVFEAVTASSEINPSPFKLVELETILRGRGYRLVEQDPISGLPCGCEQPRRTPNCGRPRHPELRPGRVSGLRRRLNLAPEDLAWLGPVAAAPVLAMAFAWLAPTLAKLYPPPRQ